jgi:hypothetical protein
LIVLNDHSRTGRLSNPADAVAAPARRIATVKATDIPTSLRLNIESPLVLLDVVDRVTPGCPPEARDL